MKEIRWSVASKHSSAARAERTYSQTGSRGEAWKSPTPSAPPCGDSESRYSRVSGVIASCVQLGGERGAAREVLEREHVDDREVVVAGEADRAVRAGQRDAGVRLGAVADEVAEAPQLVRAVGLRCRDHGLEGLPVAVDVGRDRDAHAGVIVFSVLRRLRLPITIVAALGGGGGGGRS